MNKEIGLIELRVLMAMRYMSNHNKIIKINHKDLANTMGYKSPGGALTLAIKILENKGYIKKIEEKTYKILI